MCTVGWAFKTEGQSLFCIYLRRDASSEFSNQSSAVDANQSKCNACIEFSVGGRGKMRLRVLSLSPFFSSLIELLEDSQCDASVNKVDVKRKY